MPPIRVMVVRLLRTGARPLLASVSFTAPKG